MKPYDILSAIGDVDEILIRRAHRKDLLKGVCAFFAALALLIFLSGFLMEPDFLLARFLPDSQPNAGYIDPLHLEKAAWTTMTYTSFQDGEDTGTTIFARWLLGNYTITHRDAAGRETRLVGKDGIREYQDSRQEKNLYTETIYGKDLIGRVDSILLHGKQAYPQGSQLINAVRLEYYERGPLAKQIRWDDNGTLGWRTFSYESSRIVRIQDYDAAGQPVGHTEYVYTDSGCEAASYDTSEILTGRTICQYDWTGRVSVRETYDAEGSLTGREVYHYRFWERYRGLVGGFVGILMLSLSATIGIGVYDDHISLARLTQRPRDLLTEKLDGLSAAIRALKPLLTRMKQEERKQAIARLYDALDSLNDKEGESQ